MKKDAAYWESQFRNGLAVPERPQLLARWAADSEKARNSLRHTLDLRYGPHPMQTLDLYHARSKCRALFMFIHGGYWQAMDKRDHGFIAQALTEIGVTVALPNYALCPAVTIEEIVRQILDASAWLYRNAAGFGAPRERMYVSGHSAGGHLTAMSMAAVWPRFAPDLPANLFRGGLAISGLYDLRDITRVPSINCNARLDLPKALKVSPMFLPPAIDAPLFLAVGEHELPPFRRQQQVFARRWKRVVAEEVQCRQENHYSILFQLADPASALFRSAQEMMAL